MLMIPAPSPHFELEEGLAQLSALHAQDVLWFEEETFRQGLADA